MAGINGKLDHDQRRKFIEWINEKAVNHNCPVCNHNNWTTGPQLVTPMTHADSGIMIGGASLPMALLLCNNCAFVRHFAAIPIGLIATEQKTRTNQSEDSASE